MHHVVAFSGGKDSTALLLWAKENIGPRPGEDWAAVFCDTGWESDLTLSYIEYINKTVLNGSLVTIRNQKHSTGFVSLCELKKRVPSQGARFCTSELKVLPMIEWLKGLDDDVTVYQGIRADESKSRSVMPDREWSDDYDAWIHRPLLRWTAQDCFAMMRRHGIEPNPLYLMGAKRVGCFPCVMISLRELKNLLHGPVGAELKRRVFAVEETVGRSFFTPNYIPDRFQTGFDAESGASFPWAKDVFEYVEKTDRDQLPLFPERSCMSVYNLCE